MMPEGLSTEELSLVAVARFQAMALAPYLASALTAMTFIRQEGIGTMGIDRRLRVYVDPVVLRIWTTQEIAGVLLHEVNHVIRGHHDRQVACGISPVVWNMAADLEINDDLVRARVLLPNGALIPEMFELDDGDLAERYAEQLLERCSVHVHLRCGSGAGGVADAHELDDDLTVPGVGPVQLEGIRDEVARQVSKRPGSGAGGLERWASARLSSSFPWTAVLRDAIRRAMPRGIGHHRHTWSRPRRYNPTDAILPSLRATPAHIVVIVDSSGSMDQKHLDQAASDIRTLRALPSVDRMTVAACDVEAVEVEVHSSSQPIAFIGGGGTSLEAGLDFAVDLGPRPDLVVIITDGLTDWPATKPPRLPPTVAIMPEGAPTGPEWMTTIVRSLDTTTAHFVESA